MKRKSFTLYLTLSIALSAVMIAGFGRSKIANAAEEKHAVKVSDYAPAADLVAAQQYFLTQIEESLASKEEYAEDTQERVKKNALILAVLSLHLGLHDTKNEAQTVAPLHYHLALDLAKNVKEYDTAKRNLDMLLKTQSEKPSEGKAVVQVVEGPALQWQMIRGQGAIMKKTNELNSAIKRNLTPARFEKQAEMLKLQTATLAAIAQATLLDTHEVKNPADLPAYEKYAVEFRTAAAELNKAVHAADQAAALKAFARMDTSCHTCHQKFDPPKK